MKRRDFINYSALSGAALAFDGVLWRAAAQTPGTTVKTTYGPLRGYVDNGVNVFKGVPYGASTAGANRFRPPQQPTPWSAVREATQWGHRPPQVLGGEPAEMLPPDPREPLGEDCLVMNIWTPAVTGRRPVMVWLHGGGFASGSGSYGIYSGRELARSMGSAFDAFPASKCVPAVDARWPPAEKPITPSRRGSTFHSATRARTVRIARCASPSIVG